MNYERLIQHITCIVPLSKEEISLLSSKLKSRTYLKGQYIIQVGDVYKFQTFVLSGKVKTFCLDNQGNEHILSFGLEDWWTGDICSFSTQSPAEFHTQCLENTSVAQIAYEDLEDLYVQIPKLERYFRIIVQKAYGFMSKRVVRNHSLPAKERYLQFIKTYPEIVQRFPLYMIASYLGITKEFLSSIRKQLAEE